MRVVTQIAFTHLATRKRQTAVSVVGVAMGVGFFIGMAALMQGFQQYFITKLIDVWPHVIVKDEYRRPPLQPVERRFPDGAVALHGLKPRDEPRGIRNADQILDALADVEGVAAAPTLRGQVFLRYGTKDVSATLVGIEPEQERRVSRLEQDLIAGRLEALYTAPNGIIIGEGLAEKLGVSLGDTVGAVSPAGVSLSMKIAGIFRTGITTIDNFEAYTLLKKAQVLQNRPDVINQIRLRLGDVEDARPVAERIEARYGYRTESWDETYENVLGIFVIQNGIMYSTVSAILIVAAFGIFNIISTIVHEKSRDIAILKSIGFEERDIRRVFLIEGVVVGASGTVLGWLLGRGLVLLLSAIEFEVEGFVKTEGFILYEHPAQYIEAATFAVAAATAAALLPARKAARLDPVDILRGGA